MAETIILNGRPVPSTAAALSAGDRGALYGDGLFETFRVENGVPLFPEEHLDRLEEGARILRFARVPERAVLSAGLRAAIRDNRVESGTLRLTLTRGRGGFARPLSELDEPVWWAEAREHRLDPDRYERGVSAVTASLRKNPASPLSRIKSLNYLESVLARDEAMERGADEALFLTTEGDVCEGASANLFLVKEGTLITPSPARGPLPGTVRRWVVTSAGRLGWKVEERKVDPGELRAAEEAFFTNSTWGPFPFVRIDGGTIAAGAPGPVTRRLMAGWKRAVAEQAELPNCKDGD